MRVEIVPDSSTCIVHQNFALKVRIVNVNDFPVIVPGVNLDYYVEPKIFLLRDGQDDFLLRFQASVSPWTKREITIQPGQALEKHRFLWNDNVAAMGWPDEPGIFKLRASFDTQVRLDREGARHPVEWDRPIVELHVVSPDAADRAAWNWLEPRLTAFDWSLRHPKSNAESVHLRKLRIYREFLTQFSHSSYAPAIRWEAAKLLLGMGHRTVEQEGMAGLLDESLTFCLGRGGAYAEDFLEWDADAGGSNVFEYVGVHCRHELFDLLVEKLDERYPADEQGKAYRGIAKLVVAEQLDAARAAAEDFKTKYPDSKYHRHVDGALRTMERRIAKETTEDVDR